MAQRAEAGAGLRRINLLTLLERDGRLGGPAAPAVGADEAELTRAFAAYARRLAGGVPLDDMRLAAALAMLDEAPPPSPLGPPLLELRLVAALGGWKAVETETPVREEPSDPLSPAQLMVVAFVHGEQAVAGHLAPPQPATAAARPVAVEASLRRRLLQSGDLRDGEPVATGLKRFQARHGLIADAVVGERTLAALTQPVAWQIRQVEVNLAREAQRVGRSALPRYVEVNLPAYELRLVENGAVTLRSRVIVGAEDSPTPVFDDQIRYIELNPSWYVPESIVKELLAESGNDPTYFERNNFIVSGGGDTGQRLRLTQRPGPWNALGQMKFLFPNHHAVYLHDTAQRRLFGRSEQNLSHGCVRVEKPMELAVALLGPDGWDQARIEAGLAKGTTRRVELSMPVPVLLDYQTAFVDDAETLQLRADIYGHDAAGTAMFPDKWSAAAVAAAPVPVPSPRTGEAVASTEEPATRR